MFSSGIQCEEIITAYEADLAVWETFAMVLVWKCFDRRKESIKKLILLILAVVVVLIIIVIIIIIICKNSSL